MTTISSRREELISTAGDLFYRSGFHATGIDRILADSGVAKMTLYKHFRSKTDLVVEAVKHWHEGVLAWLNAEMSARADGPADKLTAFFDVLGEWVAQDDFNGCLTMHAVAEFSSPGHPVHRLVAERNGMVIAFLEDLAAEAGANDPQALATQLLALAHGLLELSHAMSDPTVAQPVRAAAVRLIEQSTA